MSEMRNYISESESESFKGKMLRQWVFGILQSSKQVILLWTENTIKKDYEILRQIFLAVYSGVMIRSTKLFNVFSIVHKIKIWMPTSFQNKPSFLLKISRSKYYLPIIIIYYWSITKKVSRFFFNKHFNCYRYIEIKWYNITSLPSWRLPNNAHTIFQNILAKSFSYLWKLT